MAFDGKSLDDYVDVAERITQFRERYPEGHLAPLDPAEPYKIETIGEQVFIVVVAAAHRAPGDEYPGVGMAWEPFPGRTPYTRNSELMNAETSAWGRAIIAVGAADAKRGIASSQEVRNRQAERDPDADATRGGDWKPPANPAARHRADRHHATREGLPAEDNEWTTQPAAEETPGTSTLEQQQAIARALTAKGLTGRDAKLMFCTQHAGRNITSSKQLSYTEAVTVMRKAIELPDLQGATNE